jgi:hypothetical protein
MTQADRERQAIHAFLQERRRQQAAQRERLFLWVLDWLMLIEALTLLYFISR